MKELAERLRQIAMRATDSADARIMYYAAYEIERLERQYQNAQRVAAGFRDSFAAEHPDQPIIPLPWEVL